nr:3594_t:CDS:2 [Entrophospora candida]
MANWRKNFTNVPPTTKTLASILVIVSIFGAISTFKWPTGDNILSNLVVVPGVAISKFWTFLTAGFLETHLITFIGDVLMLLGCGKYLERIWGSRDFLKFVMIIIIGANLLTCITYIIEYYITDNTYYLYKVQCNGLIGLACGFLVALKQLDPEHLVFKSLFSIRIKVSAQTQFLLVIYGWIISWIYLRFFKIQDGIKGDSSETFSFASFFPEFIQELALKALDKRLNSSNKNIYYPVSPPPQKLSFHHHHQSSSQNASQESSSLNTNADTINNNTISNSSLTDNDITNSTTTTTTSSILFDSKDYSSDL